MVRPTRARILQTLRVIIRTSSLVLALILSACQPIQRLPTTQIAVPAAATVNTQEANKAVVQRFYEEVVNQKNLKALDSLFVPKLEAHDLGPTPGDIGDVVTGMPDVKTTVSLWVVEGDLVTAECDRNHYR